MTSVLITVDTELSAGAQSRGHSVRVNWESSILGRCAAGDFGIGWQMDRLAEHGLHAVFFVDPFPALVHGGQVVADIVGPILARGHEVQLHIHTEWLQWVAESPVGGRLGRSIGDFALSDQVVLLGIARDLLVAAGAPLPTAFRAGNCGANDDTLRALAAIGIAWDTSFVATGLGADCRITLPSDQIAAVRKEGVVELPISGIFDRPAHFRLAQTCALSGAEMRAALTHSANLDVPHFVIITHSFEMLSRDRRRPNRAVMARYETMCRTIADQPALTTCGFADLDIATAIAPQQPGWRLPPDLVRTGRRYADQLLATWAFERRLLRA